MTQNVPSLRDPLHQRHRVTTGDTPDRRRRRTDIIFGGSGNDMITAGAGNDYVNTGAGNDTVFATIGDGNDIYDRRCGHRHLRHVADVRGGDRHTVTTLPPGTPPAPKPATDTLTGSRTSSAARATT